jgi:uncharacterized protein (DUF2126 family)
MGAKFYVYGSSISLLLAIGAGIELDENCCDINRNSAALLDPHSHSRYCLLFEPQPAAVGSRQLNNTTQTVSSKCNNLARIRIVSAIRGRRITLLRPAARSLYSFLTLPATTGTAVRACLIPMRIHSFGPDLRSNQQYP